MGWVDDERKITSRGIKVLGKLSKGQESRKAAAIAILRKGQGPSGRRARAHHEPVSEALRGDINKVVFAILRIQNGCKAPYYLEYVNTGEGKRIKLTIRFSAENNNTTETEDKIFVGTYADIEQAVRSLSLEIKT